MARHVFTREDAARGGQARARQDSMAAARVRGGQARAARPDFPACCAAGFAATAARYGVDFARKKAAAKRRAAPTRPQAAVGVWLEQWGYRPEEDFWGEVQLWPAGQECYADWVVNAGTGARLVVEVDGAHWHDPARDAARDAALRSIGYTVCRLDADLVGRAPQQAQDQLWDALAAAAEWDPGRVAA